MLHISDRPKLFEILSQLKADQSPRFGTMSPQHMVEHLVFAVRFSYGKEPQQHHFPEEKRQKIKAFVIGTDQDFPVGFKAPFLPEEGLSALQHPDLKSAIAQLQTELSGFDQYFLQHPSAKPINPTMGELNYTEWMRFHNRHFTHHFKQFGLI